MWFGDLAGESESHCVGLKRFCLLTCGRVAAGSAPGWCCRRWRPAWGWCCTRPPPPPSCRPAGREPEPATAAAWPPWSLTGWRPWHVGREAEGAPENNVSGWKLGPLVWLTLASGGLMVPAPRRDVLTHSNPGWAHSGSELRREHHLLFFSAPERNTTEPGWHQCGRDGISTKWWEVGLKKKTFHGVIYYIFPVKFVKRSEYFLSHTHVAVNWILGERTKNKRSLFFLATNLFNKKKLWLLVINGLSHNQLL